MNVTIKQIGMMPEILKNIRNITIYPQTDGGTNPEIFIYNEDFSKTSIELSTIESITIPDENM